MKIFYDTEFIENGSTIELISIGMVTEDDREYYAVNSEANWDSIKKNPWLAENVWPHLPIRGQKEGLRNLGGGKLTVGLTELGCIDRNDSRVKPKWVIANEVREFIKGVNEPELWADFAAYDHVVLAQLWGTMMRLPHFVPMFTHEFQQYAAGCVDVVPTEQATPQHNALNDALWLRYCYRLVEGACK